MSWFQIGALLSRAVIRKLGRSRPPLVLGTIFELAFTGRNIFTGFHRNSQPQIGKDTVYRFLSSLRHNWCRLIGFLSRMIITNFLEPLTAADREKVLILDTTIYDRSCSSKVELLSRVYDHSAKKYIKRFRMLTLGWSDGVSFVPGDYAVLTSAKVKNLIQGITKTMDLRACGAKRRRQAFVKSTDLIVPMVKRALRLLIPARYLLMDSWFGFPVVVRFVMEHVHVFCMVKNTPKVFYGLDGESLTVSKSYRMIRK